MARSKKPWESRKLVAQIGRDTRPDRDETSRGLVEKGFVVLLENDDMIKFTYYFSNKFKHTQNSKNTSYYIFKDGNLLKTTWHKYKIKAKNADEERERKTEKTNEEKPNETYKETTYPEETSDELIQNLFRRLT